MYWERNTSCIRKAGADKEGLMAFAFFVVKWFSLAVYKRSNKNIAEK
ncbi:hypothetical protein JOD02_001557 [Caldicoprobacter guelmensis]|nr:hypothetical protein [Caldicoprobacter guelmensis]